MAVLVKAKCESNAILIKISEPFFTDIENALKFIWKERKGERMSLYY